MGKNDNTPYDDVFKTMVTDLPRITLKLINEMFRDTMSEKYTGNEPVEQLLVSMKEEIDSFVGDSPQFDDLTMLALQYYGAGQDKKGES